MNRDDRLFAITGGAVVTAATTFFLAYAGGITGSIEDRSVVRVVPIPAAVAPGQPDAPESSRSAESLQAPSGVIQARNEGGGSGFGNDVVRAVAAGISPHPQWVSWLVTDDLLFRFVTAVEAVADGYSPADELEFLSTRGPFVVREDEGRLVIAAGTFRRYNLAVDVLSSIDADDAVAVFRTLEPQIAEVRRDVAWHRGAFEDRLRLAVDHLLEVEVPEGEIEVERRTTTFAYASDEFERLSPAQRQLLRMGRENAAAVKAKLREIRLAFDWPAAQAPAATMHAAISGGEDEDLEPVVIAEVFADEHESDVSWETAETTLLADPIMTVAESPVWEAPTPAIAASMSISASAE